MLPEYGKMNRFQISKRWKAIALDHLKNRKLLPVIRSLDWSLSTRDPIIFNIPEHLADFYWMKHLPIVRKMASA